MGFADSIDRFFGIREHGSTVRTEFYGALLTFLSMSYILVVSPQMMVDAGLDYSQSFTATVVVSAIGCLLMGLYAKRPFAQAPAMGIAGFFVYGVVIGMGYSWSSALLAAFISGILFLVISVSKVRRMFIAAIPRGVRAAMSAGIGCFIVFIGLKNAGIIVDNPSTFVSIGDFSDPKVLLAMFCLGVTVVMVAKSMKLAVFAGILMTAAVGVLTGIVSLPDSIFASPAVPHFGNMLSDLSPEFFSLDTLMVIVSFVFVMFFDSSGTLMALDNQTEDGSEEDLGKSFVADATAATVSPVFGCIPCNAYVESAVGVDAGSRTGLTAVFVAGFFMLALFISPLFSFISDQCIVAALFMVGVSMFSNLRVVDWSDKPMMITVLTTILFIVLTYSITNGIALGLIAYCLTMLGSHRGKEVHPIVYAISAISAVYLVVSAASF